LDVLPCTTQSTTITHWVCNPEQQHQGLLRDIAERKTIGRAAETS